MENVLKDKLDRGEKAVGTFVWSCSEVVVETLGVAGLDFVIIDGEHSAIDTESMAGMIKSANLRHMTPIVRAKDFSRPSILKMLDLGAEGLIIPNVHTADDVRTIIKHAKYPGVGQRGFCVGRRVGFGYDEECADLKSYFKEANEKTLIFPMCETKEMLENLEEVVQIEGVDGIFVGPLDLSVELGIPGELTRPEFLDTLQHIVDVCKAAGKYTMIYSATEELAIKHLEMGYDSSARGVDLTILVDGFRETKKNILSNF